MIKGSNLFRLMLMLCLFFYVKGANAIDFGTQNAELYNFQEWTLSNGSYSGNPFDLNASVTFQHGSSSTSHTTEMFYAGNDTWKFRFTPTKLGIWTFSTNSSDSDLNGHIGTVSVFPNSNAEATGFLTKSGNRFAMQTGDNGEVSGYLMNVFQGDPKKKAMLRVPFFLDNTAEKVKAYAEYAKSYGSNTLTLILSVALNSANSNFINLAPQNPDLEAFEVLDTFMIEAHKAGMHVHFWRWGDDARKMSSRQLPGGINGNVDQRVTRYLAARIGPMASWSIGYGFDLHEWVNSAQLDTWEEYFHNHLGFPHIISARSHKMSNTNLTMTGYAQGDTELGQSAPEVPTYNQIVNIMSSDPNRIQFLEERNVLGRWGANSEISLRLMWDLAMGGGMGGWFGYFYGRGDGGKVADPIWAGDNTGNTYKNPQAMEAHRLFWKNRFDLSYTVANNLSSTNNVRVLKSSNNQRYIFYKENTSSFNINLSGMNGTQKAIAIDALGTYQEIDFGMLSASNQTVNFPYSSNWALAIGDFETTVIPLPTYSLVVNQGNGDGNYTAGSTVNITADAPALGKAFDQWTGDIQFISDVTAESTTLSMPNEDIEITATYKDVVVVTYDLTVSGGSGSGTYVDGATVSISANPAPEGQIFDTWVGDVSTIEDVDNSNTTIQISGSDLSISATYKDFIAPNYFARVNFQTVDAQVPQSYIADVGEIFGSRGNGFTYGWIGGANPDARQRGGNADQKVRTLTHLQKAANKIWEIDLPNGQYSLEIGCGDPSFSDQVNTLDVEGIILQDTDGQDNLDVYFADITVTDGALTVAPGTGAINAKLAYIDITIISSDPAPEEYTLTVNQGSGSGDYVAGTSVSVSANASSGFIFDQWIGDIGFLSDVNAANTTLTMPEAAVEITATYTTVPTEEYTLTVTNGSGSGSYENGSIANISADPAPEGFVFSQWGGQTATIANINAAVTTIVIGTTDITIAPEYIEETVGENVAVQVNFQTAEAPVPDGYIADTGSVFGDRGNGYSYGWLGSNNLNTRFRNGGNLKRRTLNHIQKGTTRVWEVELPNGNYDLEIGCGDPSFTDQINTLNVEGVLVEDPDGEDKFDTYNISVSVTDGRLTLTQGAGGANAKISYINISTSGFARLTTNYLIGEIDLTIYPQPATNIVQVNSNLNGTASLFSLNGELMRSFDISNSHNRLDVSGMSSGMYFLRFKGRSFKVMIKN